MTLISSPSCLKDFEGSLYNIEIECLNESIKQNSEKYFRYEAIANLTEQENDNLKEQNQYLLETLRKMKAMESKIKKLYEKTQNYKLKWKETKMEISILKQETHLYQAWLHDYREISSIDIPSLREKVHETTEIEDGLIEKESETYEKYHSHLNGCSNKAPKFHVRSYESIEEEGSDEEKKSPQLKNRSEYRFLESAV